MVGTTISNYKALEKIAQAGVRLESRVMMNIGPERSRLSFRTGRPRVNCCSQGNQIGLGYSVCWAAMRGTDSPDGSSKERCHRQGDDNQREPAFVNKADHRNGPWEKREDEKTDKSWRPGQKASVKAVQTGDLRTRLGNHSDAQHS